MLASLTLAVLAGVAIIHDGVLTRLNALLRMSESSRGMLEVVAHTSGWLLVVMAAVTCFDVLARRTGLPVP